MVMNCQHEENSSKGPVWSVASLSQKRGLQWLEVSGVVDGLCGRILSTQRMELSNERDHCGDDKVHWCFHHKGKANPTAAVWEG